VRWYDLAEVGWGRELHLKLALAALLLTPGLRGEVSQPVNLGGPGLAVELRLWRWDGAAWTSASNAGLTVSDLGTGEYVVAGLPTASGADRYELVVAAAATPELGLASYSYGARPAQRIVWQSQIASASSPRLFKRHDTHGAVALKVLSGLPEEIASAAVTFALWNPATGVAIFAGRPAQVADVVEDTASGSSGATLVYVLAPGDLAAAGRYLGEFTVCYAPGNCHTLPPDNSLELRVVVDFDGM
jgi:hypothetical protein